MKKYILDLKVRSVEQIHQRYVLIKLTDEKPLPEMLPGQFVEVRVDGSTSTFLRRPISINFVDREQNELWLLVATVGDGTKQMAKLQPGDTLNCVLPLGNGFTPAKQGEKGFVTNHSILAEERFDRISTCGPTPMMKAVARYARQNNVDCEVSLENLMACGLGACLCCVEKTTEGNLCVCKDGPVFNIKKLLWQD